jgi:hypothetical protein
MAVATGKKAQTLKELLSIIYDIQPGCIYYHFWGDKLRPKFVDMEYFNDFAFWAWDSLNDTVLAERLAVLDPTIFPDLESLRQEIIDILEERLDETEHATWTHADQQLHFIHSQIVVFETEHTIEKPEHLAKAISSMSLSSVFYHFIDARQRTPEHVDDFRAWLLGMDHKYQDIMDRIAQINAYFTPLPHIRELLADAFQENE